ncbi:hypothetical protein [Oryzibacter oryziterrae]|uniref:hypothetical protein n=1 Tax=Oryzibacter oryziterrae TaxID=2766474 RepID=UPI001F35330E|nr:hypothetical protein [Oryzibacter oryziterrae]
MRVARSALLLGLLFASPAFAGEFDAPPLRECGPTSDSSCAYERQVLADQWPKALGGDYQSQRNIAFCLSDGCYDAMQVDKVAACAWRMVIVASGDPSVERGDLDNYVSACRMGLSTDEQQAARTTAERMFILIYARRLPQFNE